MINKFNSIFVIFIFTTLNGQFISELPINNTPSNLDSHPEKYIDLIKTSRKVKAAAVSMKRVFFFEKFSALQVLRITNFRMKKIPFEIKVR